ncbi:hypothetical protein EON62_04470 [archaeon]|nr:MAG: hypothetical protein EON62_04470 [archaeon]
MQADGLHIAELPAPIGRGVIAEAPIKAKTTLVSVPLSATMSLQSADASVRTVRTPDVRRANRAPPELLLLWHAHAHAPARAAECRSRPP